MFSRTALRCTPALDPMIRMCGFPGRYVQGPKALARLGEELSRFGSSAFILSDPFVAKTMNTQIDAALKQGGKLKGTNSEVFNAECCDDEIARLCKIAKGSTSVAGIGGGKTLDTAKIVAHELSIPVAIIPTIASTDAPCSSLAVVYTPTGGFDRYIMLPKSPDLVMLDSEIIANAPVRFLVAGMGDALATWFEAESCMLTQSGNIDGYLGSHTSFALARMCYDALLEYGVAAKRACEAKVTCPALERIIEANTLLSGVGAISGGLGAAHAIHNGFTALDETHAYMHGEKVAVGLAASLFLTDRPPQVIDTVYKFCEDVGLPTTLADIGVTDVTAEKLLSVARSACAKGETMHNEAGIMTPEAVAAAMRAADAYGIARKKQNKA